MPSTAENPAKTSYLRAKNFVRTHKTCIMLGTAATAVIAVQGRAIHQFNEFLEEKGLKDEFYNEGINDPFIKTENHEIIL